MNNLNDDLQAFYAALRSDLAAFTRKTFNTVSPADEYQHNWHIEAMAHQLSRVISGDCNRLIITMPPRHMKSIMSSVALPAYMLGHCPDKRIIGVSYSQDLATKFSIETRMIMEQAWYKRCFPGAYIRKKQDTQEGFFTTKQGFRMSTSVGGTLTGHGGDILLIDDPHKADEALSDTKRKKVLEWYTHTASTRLNDPETGAIVLVMQRFHEEDLAGYLLEQGGWEHLNLPALAEGYEQIAIGPNKFHIRNMGEALHPARMSEETLKQKQYEMGEQAFSAQYQQRPSPAGGTILRREWFRSYGPNFRPAPQHHQIIQSWDTAYTTNANSDYTVCMTFAYQDYRLYLIDVLRVKIQFSDLLAYIPVHGRRFNASKILIEASGAGLGLYEELNRRYPRAFLANVPKVGKEIRLLNGAQSIALGRVVLPESAPWLQCFLDEVLGFPNTKHDDQVDSLSQVLTWLRNYGGRPPIGHFDEAA